MRIYFKRFRLIFLAVLTIFLIFFIYFNKNSVPPDSDIKIDKPISLIQNIKHEETVKELDHATVITVVPESKQKPIDLNERYSELLRKYGDSLQSEKLEKYRLKIKGMMKECWDIYSAYAFGDNEVDVIRKSPLNKGVFGNIRGVTIVDSIDTLFIMGLFPEYEKARNWIEEHLDFPTGNTINLFENTIRIFGGLLSIYYLTNDKMFLEKAILFADRTVTSFGDKFPPPRVTFKDTPIAQSHISGVNLAEIGTLHLEYTALTDLTNNQIYKQKVDNIRNILYKIFKSRNRSLVSDYLMDGTPTGARYSIGSRADSFFEYLLKSYIYNKNDVMALNFFEESISKLNSEILTKNSQNMYYYGVKVDNFFSSHMEHLACFTGGMFGLADSVINKTNPSVNYLEIGRSLTETCYKSCKLVESGLCPETFDPTKFGLGMSGVNSPRYSLQPELIESLFYMFRLTGEEIYREKLWSLMESIIANTRVETGGYSSVSDINQIPTIKSGLQESFFMAETLKYAYLAFSPVQFISLNDWVFNTEAHPFKIIKKTIVQ